MKIIEIVYDQENTWCNQYQQYVKEQNDGSK